MFCRSFTATLLAGLAVVMVTGCSDNDAATRNQSKKQPSPVSMQLKRKQKAEAERSFSRVEDRIRAEVKSLVRITELGELAYAAGQMNDLARFRLMAVEKINNINDLLGQGRSVIQNTTEAGLDHRLERIIGDIASINTQWLEE